MTDDHPKIAIGDIVLIEDDLHDLNRYIVLKIKDTIAKIKIIHPTASVSWVDINELQRCSVTKEEAIAEWRKRHDYSGL